MDAELTGLKLRTSLSGTLQGFEGIPRASGEFAHEGATFQVFDRPVLRGARWTDADFQDCDFGFIEFVGLQATDSKLNHCGLDKAMLSSCQFQTCIFDGCNFEQTRFFSNALWGGKNSTFANCTFNLCDFRGSIHSATIFGGCRFENCDLERVSFVGSIFTECTFVGSLKEAFFFDRDPRMRQRKENHLLKCDFTKAVLEDCSFVNVCMVDTRLPVDTDVILLPNGRSDLDHWASIAKIEKDFFVQEVRKTMGLPGILGLRTLRELYSEDQIALLLRHLGGYKLT